jgi:hypothetical protein
VGQVFHTQHKPYKPKKGETSEPKLTFTRRVSHHRWHLGIASEPTRSESGLNVCAVRFDSTPSVERTILAAFLEPSNEPMPSFAKTAKVRKKRVDCPDVDKPTAPAAQVSILPQWDTLPDESEDRDEIVPEVETTL